MKKIALVMLLMMLSLTFTTYAAEIPLKEKYTQEELDYFCEVAFGAECGSQSYVIHKWDKTEIKISIVGNPAEEHIKELNKVMNELTDLTSINFKIVDKDADIKIYFINHSDFGKYTPNNDVLENSHGYFYIWWDKNNVIYKGNIFIAIDQEIIETQKHLIREELTQSLGLMNDSYTYADSMFYQGIGIEREYTDIDKSIIKLLYEQSVKPRMKKNRVQRLFN